MVKTSFLGAWRGHALAFLFAVIIVLATIAEPVIYGRIIDKITEAIGQALSPRSAISEISPYLIIWAVLFFVGAIATALKMYISWYAANRVTNHFIDRLYCKIMRLGIRWHNDAKPGDVLRRFDRAWNGLWVLQLSLTRSIIPSILSFIIVLGVGFYLHWQLTLVALSPIPIALILGIFSFKRLEKRQSKVNKGWEKIFSKLGDFFSNIMSVKSATAEEYSRKRFVELLRQTLKKQLALNKWWAVSEAGQDGLTVIARLLIFIFGVYYVVSGSISLGTLITFLGFTTFIYIPLQTILGSEIPQLTEAYTGLKRITPWYNLAPEIKEVKDAISLDALRGDIEFHNVTFAYKKQPALKNVSFSVRAGTTVALVGESGSGKSTAAALISRLYDPENGAITIDGHDLRTLSIQSLRANIGFVLQENLLFHDTISNNVRFTKPRASQAEVIKACKRAQAHNFIMNLSKKYNSIVGERGIKLSGGEKQRVIIARTLLKDPPILVLDEATSALDSKTEYELRNALTEIMKNRTTVVIAHRLSTIMAADQILVFDNGRLVERGTHKKLSRVSKIYKQLWNLQVCGYIE